MNANTTVQAARVATVSTEGYDVTFMPVTDEVTLETKQSVLARVIESNRKLPRFANDEIELFVGGTSCGKY